MKKLIVFFALFFIIACQQDIIEQSENLKLKSAKIEQPEINQIIVKYKNNPYIQVIKGVQNIDVELALLLQSENVEYAEPDLIVETCETSNDPYYTGGYLWGMTNCGADQQWEKGNTGSSEVVVVVLDEGIMYYHEDLIDNIWVNYEDIANDGLDNDDNGYIDDVLGWDWKNNDNTIYDGIPSAWTQKDRHGTHVSGTIGAMGGNGIGVAGVNWNVKMMSCKFLEGSGTVSDAVKAIDYIIAYKQKGVNIVAVNASWGMTSWKGNGYSQALYDAINLLKENGILFVCAAGNSGFSLQGQRLYYPASYDLDNIIAVGAIDSKGEIALFSNTSRQHIDLMAPGVGVYSTLPNELNESIYGAYNGTSMATPHVTGAVALYKSLHPDANWSAIKSVILNSTIPDKRYNGKCVSGGRLNIINF